MRIAVLVIGLVLCLGLFIQSLAATAVGHFGKDSNTSGAAAVGILMALLWVVACGLVIPTPRVSMVIFATCAVFGVAAGSTSLFHDLIFWGVVSGVLALFSYLGYRGKRKQQAKEATRDAEHAALVRQVAELTGTQPQG